MVTHNRVVAQLQAVRKTFGRVPALDGVDLEIVSGRIVGLLGANGSGKSTLLRHLIGLYLPDAGRVTTFGRPAGDLGPQDLSRIGYVHQNGELIEWMRVEQLIRYVRAYYPAWNDALTETYVRQFDLPLRRCVGGLSPGDRQKLAILLAIGHEPGLTSSICCCSSFRTRAVPF